MEAGMEKIQQPPSPSNRVVPYFLIHKIPLVSLDILKYFYNLLSDMVIFC